MGRFDNIGRAQSEDTAEEWAQGMASIESMDFDDGLSGTGMPQDTGTSQYVGKGKQRADTQGASQADRGEGR